MSVGWEPFRELAQLRERVNRSLAAVLGGVVEPGSEVYPGPWRPAAEMVEGEATLEIALDVAGVAPESIVVRLEEGRVLVEGQRPAPDLGPAGTFTRAERGHGPFRRELPLPGGRRAAGSPEVRGPEAGVLTLSIPLQPRPGAGGRGGADH